MRYLKNSRSPERQTEKFTERSEGGNFSAVEVSGRTDAELNPK